MSEATKRTILEFIRKEIHFRDDAGSLGYDKPLLGDVIDSMGIQMLVPFLENEYGVSIPDVELVPEHFQDINSIAALVERLPKNKATL